MISEIKWEEVAAKLDFAFQPIVNIYTGTCMGVEVLLRNYQDAGFETIQDVFDFAFETSTLNSFDLILREKAIKKFILLPFHQKCKLFYNIDNRTLTMPDYSPGITKKILQKYGLDSNILAFELSEKHKFEPNNYIKDLLKNKKNQLFKIAIDDFGTGFSGLQLLYNSEPDFIKIDRFFISAIQDPRKQLFVSKIINMAHMLGIVVIAEGVETEEEFMVCKKIGCDFVQGYFIQKPTVDINLLSFQYDTIRFFNSKEKRKLPSDSKIILENMDYIDPINVKNTTMTMVLELFRNNKYRTFFPVVDEFDEPLGVVREQDLKEYVYSRYGQDLLLNTCMKQSVMNFVTRCPIAEIHKSAENILDIFSLENNSEGIIISENSVYVGFLSAQSLLKVLHEKNLAAARDQNPLSNLPGNKLINQFISESFYNQDHDYLYAYFDFDNFKPFNDNYGFRLGDRAILLFSEILRSFLNGDCCFVGHVGGDDFFAGIKLKERQKNITDKLQVIDNLVDKFNSDIQSFYSDKDRQKGFITASDRQGKKCRYPLLTVSSFIILISEETRSVSLEKLFEIITDGKKGVKAGNKKTVYSDFNSKPKSSNRIPPHIKGDYLFSNLSRWKELESDLAISCSGTQG